MAIAIRTLKAPQTNQAPVVIEDTVQLSPAEEAQLLEAIAEIDRGETISADELFARLDRLR